MPHRKMALTLAFMWNYIYSAANYFRGTFAQYFTAVEKTFMPKTLYFMPIAYQRMLADCGANTRRLLWSTYVMHTTMPTELCIT